MKPGQGKPPLSPFKKLVDLEKETENLREDKDDDNVIQMQKVPDSPSAKKVRSGSKQKLDQNDVTQDSSPVHKDVKDGPNEELG